MSEHTKGTWIVDSAIPYLVNREEDNRRIAYIAPNDQQANAHLIAAAPDLLEALIEVAASLAWNAHGECRAINDGPIMPSAMAIEVARAAIAKAKGESV